MLNFLIRFYLILSQGLPFSEDYGSFEALNKTLKKKKICARQLSLCFFPGNTIFLVSLGFFTVTNFT